MEEVHADEAELAMETFYSETMCFVIHFALAN